MGRPTRQLLVTRVVRTGAGQEVSLRLYQVHPASVTRGVVECTIAAGLEAKPITLSVEELTELARLAIAVCTDAQAVRNAT